MPPLLPALWLPFMPDFEVKVVEVQQGALNLGYCALEVEIEPAIFSSIGSQQCCGDIDG